MADKPDQANDPISKASQGANWFVGLSGAAVGGGLAKLDMVEKFPFWGKVFFVIAAFFFLWSIVSGIFYYFQLLALAQASEKLTREEAKEHPDQAAIKAARDKRDAANLKISLFHFGAFVTFPLACMATVACLSFVIFAPAPVPAANPPVAPANHFSLTNVPVYIGGRISHSHTFLLDEQSGDAWLMICQPNKTVEFRKVKRLKLDGTSEDVSSTAALPAHPSSPAPR